MLKEGEKAMVEVYILEKDLKLDVLPFSPTEGMTREQIVGALLASGNLPIGKVHIIQDDDIDYKEAWEQLKSEIEVDCAGAARHKSIRTKFLMEEIEGKYNEKRAKKEN